MKNLNTTRKIALSLMLSCSSILSAQVQSQGQISKSKEVIDTSSANSSECAVQMNSTDFQTVTASMEAKPMSQAKLNIVKRVIENNCLSVSQVRELAMLFSIEDDKLEVAKLCYGKTVDFKDYGKLNDIFTFAASGEDLSVYIRSFKR
jgi:hypothetical protein